MTEKLRFEQVAGNRTRVDGDEGFVGAGGCGVNGFGDDFLTGSAFTADQYGGTGRRDLGDQIEHGLHLVTLADDVGKIVALLQGALELDVFIAQAAAFDGYRDLGDEFIVRPRLGDEILGATFEGGAGHVDGAVGGDQNDRNLRVAQAYLAQQFEPVAVGEADIEQHEIEGIVFELLQADRAGFGEGHLKIFRGEKSFQPFPDLDFIIYNEN